MKYKRIGTFQKLVKRWAESGSDRKAYVSLEVGSEGDVIHLPVAYATIDADGDLVINAYPEPEDANKTYTLG